MKFTSILCALMLPLLAAPSYGEVNSGSDGHDGALNPTESLVIDMADHPDGIYHYSSVNIPTGVTVSFIPNAGNKPVVWLVQGDCLISGSVDVAGKDSVDATGGPGGPGGWRGGSGINPTPQAGEGPGGGNAGSSIVVRSGWSYTYLIDQNPQAGSYGNAGSSASPDKIYGNMFNLPLLGGSGGGGFYVSSFGTVYLYGGGGGGGAFLVASSGSIRVDGTINAIGGSNAPYGANGGSGGAVRIVGSSFRGNGTIDANGRSGGGAGRIRIDAMQSTFGGSLYGTTSQGFQPIIMPSAGEGIQLAIQNISGISVSLSPAGVLVNPDVVIPAQQSNPIPIMVGCNNIPLNSEISVIVHPVNGPDVQAVGMNNSGTLASSTATVSLNMPRGGGIIYAKCVSGLAGLGADTSSKELRTKSLAETGWTTDGERFAKMEVTANLGGAQQISYITESGKRYPATVR